MSALAQFLIDEAKARGIDCRELALKCDLTANQITGLITGRTVINKELAEHLAKGFSTSSELWLNLGKKVIKEGTVCPWCHRKTSKEIVL